MEASHDLKAAMEELGLDPKDPDFSEAEMLNKFRSISQNQNIHFFQRDRYKHLIAICGEHKFWEAQPIELPK
jgi:hypothetical protein